MFSKLQKKNREKCRYTVLNKQDSFINLNRSTDLSCPLAFRDRSFRLERTRTYGYILRNNNNKTYKRN